MLYGAVHVHDTEDLQGRLSIYTFKKKDSALIKYNSTEVHGLANAPEMVPTYLDARPHLLGRIKRPAGYLKCCPSFATSPCGSLAVTR